MRGLVGERNIALRIQHRQRVRQGSENGLEFGDMVLVFRQQAFTLFFRPVDKITH